MCKSVSGRSGNPQAFIRRPRTLATARPCRAERNEPGGSGGDWWPPQSKHPCPIHFPPRPLPKTHLAHTYVFPSDEEVFILNSFYRDGEFVSDKLQGLWVGDMDFVRVQLEAMLLDLSEPRGRRALPRSRQTG